ncbi:hypothetical protein HRbin01_01352 [archaeon HR01]|nr:hypothetical protein HRbin01_01352 [archaeon HR01]
MRRGGGGESIGHAAFCPGRDITIFNLRISNKPGSLYQVLNVFKNRSLNIVHLSSLRCQCLPEDFTDVAVFTDFTGLSITVEELLEELRCLDVVVEVVALRPELPGLAVNMAAFPLELLGYRAIVLRKPVYMGLFYGMRKRLGSAGDALIYHVGLEAGRGLGADIIRMGYADRLPIALKLIEIIHGRAVLEFVEYKPREGRYVVRAYHLFECEDVESPSQPNSSFYRGFLAGIMESVMGIEMSVTETKCIAVGDEYCEFRLEPRSSGNPMVERQIKVSKRDNKG